MNTIKFHHVDSFTTNPFEGNSTAAVFDAHLLTEAQMKKMAIEFQHAESSFLLPSDKADFKLRFFTKGGDEIKFCGHATIGALCAIAKDKLYGLTSSTIYNLKVETNAGVLPVEIDLTNRDDAVYSFDLPKIDLVDTQLSLKEIAEALSIPLEAVDQSKPLMLERTHSYLYFTVKSLDALKNLKIDFAKTAEFCKKNGIVLICALTPHAYKSHNHVHARGFAPAVNIPEDPFTGSMQGGLAAYLRKHSMISQDQPSIGSEQGHFIGKPGEALIKITGQNPVTARLYGKAAHLYSAHMKIGKA